MARKKRKKGKGASDGDTTGTEELENEETERPIGDNMALDRARLMLVHGSRKIGPQKPDKKPRKKKKGKKTTSRS